LLSGSLTAARLTGCIGRDCVQTLLSALCLNWRANDVGILRRSGVLPVLHRLCSIATLAEDTAQSLRDATVAAGHGLCGSGTPWRPWPYRAVAIAVQRGTLSVEELLTHIAAGCNARAVPLPWSTPPDPLEMREGDALLLYQRLVMQLGLPPAVTTLEEPQSKDAPHIVHVRYCCSLV
jgi:hypothetical protein